MNRRQLADSIDALDAQIAELQREKSEFYAAYREHIEKTTNKDQVKLELAAVKVAIRQRQKLAKDPAAVTEKDDLVDAIVVEITRPTKNSAPAATAAPMRAALAETPPTRARTTPELDDIPPDLDRRRKPAEASA